MKWPRLFVCLALPVFWATPFTSSAQRVQLSPQLHSGQTLFYRVDLSASRNTRTESRVVSPQIPPTFDLSLSGILQVEVSDASSDGFRLKTYFSEREPSPASSSSPAAPSRTADKLVEVFIARSGAASQLRGYEQLSAEQKMAWSGWLARFTTPMAFPSGGLRPGQKWESDEPETTPAPLAGLSWKKRYQYVRDEPCVKPGSSSNSNQKMVPRTDEQCAVVFINASLRQKSSPNNSTPEEYKLNNLKTRGTASGQNETILYIARSSGLLIRSTEEAKQTMEVGIALSDESNQLHYSLGAKSRSELVLLSDLVN